MDSPGPGFPRRRPSLSVRKQLFTQHNILILDVLTNGVNTKTEVFDFPAGTSVEDQVTEVATAIWEEVQPILAATSGRRTTNADFKKVFNATVERIEGARNNTNEPADLTYANKIFRITDWQPLN